MNDLLELKGQFLPKQQNPNAPIKTLPARSRVTLDKINNLIANLEEVEKYWRDKNLLPNIFVSIRYIRVIPKSHRVQNFFTLGGRTSNDSVVGARFNQEKNKHIFTHYITRQDLRDTVAKLRIVANTLKKSFGEAITDKDIDNINKNSKQIDTTYIAKTKFVSTIVDCYFAENIYVHEDVENITETAIVTIYDIGQDSIRFLNQIGIAIGKETLLDNTTMRLTPDQLARLKEKAPYLISMEVVDFSLVTKDNFKDTTQILQTIPNPVDEPIVGVIDTMFDNRVYFSEWVDFENRLSNEIELENNDYNHGTAVTSIIVDGPAINPELNDNCGRFRVKHFGVAQARRTSTFTVLREIEKIVAENPNIKVWNLSLGSDKAVNEHFISPESAFLDKLQFENDVLFIVSATNKIDPTVERVGSPADSINSIVVNSVNFQNKPASYARKGPVLTFFQKPDISYYGGDTDKGIFVCSPTGKNQTMGTSYAAPWITRKVAYLVYKMKLTREEAKALIIDSAAGWNNERTDIVGFGIVPIKIDDILKSPAHEIKFIISEVSKRNTIYNYNIPIPLHAQKFPYSARATICYFSPCSRKQGVDYTDTELTPKLGRVDDRVEKIKPIDNNRQYEEGSQTTEHSARKLFSKWENVKLIRESGKKNRQPKDNLSGRGMWGLEIRSLGRVSRGENIKFGIVVTLRELNGINRINSFMQRCIIEGWRVHRINMEAQVEIHSIANQEIKFDE